MKSVRSGPLAVVALMATVLLTVGLLTAADASTGKAPSRATVEKFVLKQLFSVLSEQPNVFPNAEVLPVGKKFPDEITLPPDFDEETFRPVTRCARKPSRKRGQAARWYCLFVATVGEHSLIEKGRWTLRLCHTTSLGDTSVPRDELFRQQGIIVEPKKRKKKLKLRISRWGMTCAVRSQSVDIWNLTGSDPGQNFEPAVSESTSYTTVPTVKKLGVPTEELGPPPGNDPGSFPGPLSTTVSGSNREAGARARRPSGYEFIGCSPSAPYWADPRYWSSGCYWRPPTFRGESLGIFDKSLYYEQYLYTSVGWWLHQTGWYCPSTRANGACY